MPRAERRTPRAGARGHLPARATSGACGDGTRVCPGRGAPIFASARRRGAGEVARRGVYVTFLAHRYSCATRAVFLTRHSRARRRAPMTRGTRATRSARDVRRAESIATFAAIIRVDLARRARRSRRDRGRMGIVPLTVGQRAGGVSVSSRPRTKERFRSFRRALGAHSATRPRTPNSRDVFQVALHLR